jgi:hypothetical protein
VHPTVVGCQVLESLQSLLLRRDCVEIRLLAVAAVTAGEGSPGDAEPPNRFCDRGNFQHSLTASRPGEWRWSPAPHCPWPRSMPST